MKKVFIFSLFMYFGTVLAFAQFERKDSILSTWDLNKKASSIASSMYFPPAEFYWNDTLYYMDRSPLAYINRSEFWDIYPEWPFFEEMSFNNYIYRGRYDCVWELTGDSLYLVKIRKHKVSKFDKEEYSPYTYDEVKERMENFTGYKFADNEKMFAGWLTGSIYVMPPFELNYDSFESYEEYDIARRDFGKQNILKLIFKNGKLIASEKLN